MNSAILRVFVGFFCAYELLHACDLSIEQGTNTFQAVSSTETQDVLLVTYTRTHKNCQVPLQRTKLLSEGATILGATAWEEVKPGVFQRKVKVAYSRSGTNVLRAVRSCERGGDEAVLTKVLNEANAPGESGQQR